jgi:hypothetical protein
VHGWPLCRAAPRKAGPATAARIGGGQHRRPLRTDLTGRILADQRQAIVHYQAIAAELAHIDYRLRVAAARHAQLQAEAEGERADAKPGFGLRVVEL